jgi:hypothetical protein
MMELSNRRGDLGDESEIRKKYPKLFEQPGMGCETSIISRMKFILRGKNVKPDKTFK